MDGQLEKMFDDTMLGVVNSGLTTSAVEKKKEAEKKEKEKKKQPEPKQKAPSMAAIKRLAPKKPVGRPKGSTNSTTRAKSPARKPASKPSSTKGVNIDDEKVKVYNKIQMYYEYFDNLQKTSPKKFSLLDSLPVLKAELERCRRVLNQSSALATVHKLDLFTNWTIQTILVNMNIPAQNLVYTATMEQELVEQELLELSIEYNEWLSQGPLTRYIMKTAQRIGLVVQKNRAMQMGAGMGGNPNGGRFAEEKMNEMNNKYGDL